MLKNILRKKELLGLLFLGIFIILLDQLTKFFARSYLQTPVYINKFFSFDLSFNRGISWGVFHTNNIIFFYLISFIIAVVLALLGLYIINRLNSGHSVFAEFLVLSGGVSNLIDRFFYEGVVDFLAFNFGGFSFPNFNIADIFITLGVFFMFIKIIFYED